MGNASEDYRHGPEVCSLLIESDYLNEFMPLINFLRHNGTLPETYTPKSFSNCYPNRTFSDISFSTTPDKNTQIEALDKFAQEASNLLNKNPINKKALQNIVVQVTKICNWTLLSEEIEAIIFK